MSAIAFWEFVIVFLLGLVSVPMPLGVPPLPEDPNLLRAAPRETIAYFSWFGRATANPKSQNLTERLAAEPEVRDLVLTVGKALRQSLETMAGDEAQLAAEGFNALTVLADRPGCAFVSGVDLPPNPFSIRGGLVVNLGAKAALLTPTLLKFEKVLAEGLTRGEGETRTFAPMPGLKFRALPMPDDAPALSWGMVDRYLVVALGEGEAKRIARGLRGETDGMTGHQFFKTVQAKVRVARPCFRTFVDLAQIVEKGQTLGREVGEIVKILGLTDLQLLLSETGLEGEGFIARTMLATRGNSGLLSLMEGPPLSTDELAIIPGDATFASAVRVSPRKLLGRVMDLVEKIDPRASQEFQEEVVEPLKQATGLDLEKDLLAHIGDTLALWNSPQQGGLLFTGATLALELDNAAQFGQSFTKAMASLKEMMPGKQRNRWGRLRRGTYLETVRHRGTEIWFMNSVGDDLPFAPAWCVTDKHLMFSLFPQMLKAGLDAPGGKSSLAQHPKVQATEVGVGLTMFDIPRMFDAVYAAVHPLAQLAVGELQREGLDITIAALPTAPAIRPHMSTEISNLVVRPDGWLLTRQGSIPIVDPALGFAMPLVGIAPMWMVQQRQMAAMQAERARARAEARKRAQDEEKKKRQNAEKKK